MSIDTSLYDQDTFFKAFLSDLRHCKRELIIDVHY